MPRPKDVPVAHTHDPQWGDTYEHPSYAMVQFNRVHNSNTTKLFGSSLRDHHTTIRMAVRQAAHNHHLSRDWYRARGRDLIEIELSAAQFASLLTEMNIGSGVPCTLRYFNGEMLPNPPETPTEVERVKTGFEERMENIAAKLQSRVDAIKALAAKLPAKAQKQLEIELGCIVQEINSNVPFVLEQFNKAADKVVTASKHEIEAFAQHRVFAAGVEALDAAKQPQLPAPQGYCDADVEGTHGSTRDCNNPLPCKDHSATSTRASRIRSR